jgi:hypothetical protein
MFGVSLGIRVGNTSILGGGFDSDAQAYFDRVTTAGGTLTTTEKNAVNQLVLDLKANSLWTPMKAIYPMVGASAAACAQNLKSSSFTGTFTSGWTFASTGATPNGTSAYMNIGLNPSMVLTNNNYHLSHYSLTQKTTGTEVDFAAISPSPVMISLAQYYQGVGKGFVAGDYIVSAIAVLGATNTRGFQVNTRSSQTSAKMFLNNSQVGSTLTLSNTNPLPNANMSLGSNNNGGSYYEYSSKQCAFASIGDGLTDTQASNFYTAVQAFNQTLDRQVGAQIVSDADAQAYINRVYTAGGTLTNTEANAVNQLVIDLKANSLWTPMKAIYPMVGASAAACAQNLKSSSFTGTFSSGWTFASTGVTPNGSSAYMSTGFNPRTSLTNSSGHFSYYSRTNSAGGNKYEMANYDGTFGNGLIIRYSSDTFYAVYGQYNANTTNTDSRGFFVTNRNSLTNTTGFKNGTKLIDTITTGTTANKDIILGAENFNTISGFTDRQCAFSSIGDGLTDAQVSALYTNVQTFQTTLNRQVV